MRKLYILLPPGYFQACKEAKGIVDSFEKSLEETIDERMKVPLIDEKKMAGFQARIKKAMDDYNKGMDEIRAEEYVNLLKKNPQVRF